MRPLFAVVVLLAAAGSLLGQTTQPVATQPTYPLWDGKETVADYAKRAGIKDGGSLFGQTAKPAVSQPASVPASGPTASPAEVYTAWPFDANEAARRQDETAKALGVPKELVLKLDANVSMKLVLIPAGKFVMGSSDEEQVRLRNEADAAGSRAGNWFKHEGPLHEVTISKPFYMGVYHVIRGQFTAFTCDSCYRTEDEGWGWAIAIDGNGVEGLVGGASWKKPGFEQTDEHPVVCVSRNDAVAFCKWLSKKTGKTVTLPTEARWEYACRAGTTTAYQWGDNPDEGKGWCNAADQSYTKRFTHSKLPFSWDDGYFFTSPVGKFKPNAFGLYDMHGNAIQWCSDFYDANYYTNEKSVDPQGPRSGLYYVLRGGSWSGIPRYCRSANRTRSSPQGGSCVVGFRVVVEIEESRCP